jgi:hypothetical protein
LLDEAVGAADLVRDSFVSHLDMVNMRRRPMRVQRADPQLGRGFGYPKP